MRDHLETGSVSGNDWLEDIDWDLRSTDVRHLQNQVARYLKVFNLKPHPATSYRGRLVHRQLHRTRLTVIDYGAAIDLDAGKLGSFSILQQPLRGSYTLQAGDELVQIMTGQAHLIAPGVPINMSWSADCILLVVRLDARGAAELGLSKDRGHRAAAMAQKLSGSLRSDLGVVVPLDQPSGASLGRALDFALRESLLGSWFAQDGDARQRGEQLLLAALGHALDALLTEPDLASPEAGPGTDAGPAAALARKPTAVPAYLRRAETYLLQHLGGDICLRDVAEASGVASSTLVQAFQKAHGTGPLGWWRARRLDRAYEDLSRTAPSGDDLRSVTDIGMAWGFNHLGRFSQAYAKRFGELPRQTLQRARARS